MERNSFFSFFFSSSFLGGLSYVVFLSSAWKAVGMTNCHVFLSSFGTCFRTLAVILVSDFGGVPGFVSEVNVSSQAPLHFRSSETQTATSCDAAGFLFFPPGYLLSRFPSIRHVHTRRVRSKVNIE